MLNKIRENIWKKNGSWQVSMLVGWLFGFYGVSTFVGYLTPNYVHMYILFTNEYLVGKIFLKQDFTCLHMINQI